MSFLSSVWTYKCPRCRQTKIYKEPFQLSEPVAMPECCAKCELRFEPEPGYYWGAMFISYILSGWFFLIIALSLIFLAGWSVNQAMAAVLVVAALTYMKFLRFSRSLWIHLMVKYDSEKANP